MEVLTLAGARLGRAGKRLYCPYEGLRRRIMMAHTFLVHHVDDSVGVAVTDIDAGSEVTGRVQSTGEQVQLRVSDPVPLGHKLALRDIPAGEPVTKYGVTIGLATAHIRVGNHVHVHNLKGQRWS
jgi:(2R)-sulfolactate sulfo-lyase subunit alpha